MFFYFKYIYGKFKCNKFKTILNIFSVAIGLALILAIRLSTTNNINALRENAKQLNGGDISISPYSQCLSEKQISKLKELQASGSIRYSVGTWMKTTGQFKNKSVNMILRFVDFEQYPYYAAKPFAGFSDSENGIILSKNLAQQLNASVNDNIFIFNNRTGNKKDYTIEKIVELDSETDLDMNLFGYAFIRYSESAEYLGDNSMQINKIYVRVDSNHVNDIKKRIEGIFEREEIQTADQLYKENEKEVKNLMKSISIIGILATIMGGIGIASTVLLNVKKEQKEICLLRVLGMERLSLNFLVVMESCLIGMSSFVISIPIGIFFSNMINRVLYEGMEFKLYSNYIYDIIILFFIATGISVIFSFLPAKICNRLSPSMILRETELSNEKKIKMLKPLLLTCTLLIIAITIYFGDMRIILYTILFLLLACLALLLLRILFYVINWICKIPKISRSIFSFTVKILEKNLKKLCLIITTLLIGLISIGLTQNISGSILPGVEAMIDNQLGYNVLLTSSRKNEEEINKILDANSSAKSFSQTLRMDTVIVKVNGQDVRERLKKQYIDENDFLENKDMLKNLTVEGLEINQNNNLNIIQGREFDISDNAKNSILINENLAEVLGLKCGDIIQLNINNINVDHEIVGIFEKQLVNTAEIKVPMESLSSNAGWTSVTYYLNIQSENLDGFIQKMYREIEDCFIINMSDMSPSLYKTVRKQIKIFEFIAAIAIVSFLLFMTNIILIDKVGRKKEFIICKVYGASYMDIIKIFVIEAIIMGIFSGCLAYVLCNAFTRLFLHVFLGVEYVKQTIGLCQLLFIGSGVSVISMLLVLPQISISKLTCILREY